MATIDLPTVSVIIPTFKHEQFIAQTLESVLSQTRRPDEIIVVNDGSPDGTDSAVQPFLDRVTYAKQQNGGISAALNCGVNIASGEYMLCLASDDWLCPNALEVLAAPLDLDPEVGVSYADIFLVGERGQLLAEEFPRRSSRRTGKQDATRSLIEGNFIPAMACLVRAEALRDAGGFRDYPYSQDWAMWLQLALNGWRFFGSEEQVAYYRRHGGNTTHSRNEAAGLINAIDMLRGFQGVGDNQTHMLAKEFERAVAEYERCLARVELNAGRTARARRRYFRLLRSDRCKTIAVCGLVLSMMPVRMQRVALRRRSRALPAPHLDRSYHPSVEAARL